MRIVAIETSCDETAISIIEAQGTLGGEIHFKVLSNMLLSQIKLHAEYGGVFPSLAKREHSKNLIPLLTECLKNAGLLVQKKNAKNISEDDEKILSELLHKEPEMLSAFRKLYKEYEIPQFDVVAVTYGPGLEPALWTGINLAKALNLFWKKTVIPVNHMEGHIISSVLSKIDEETLEIPEINFPALALLISGGHTELVLMQDYLKYTIIGQTRDDAVGEAFDKVARILGLPYPGGPQISKLAEKAREDGIQSMFTFPRPMIHSKDFDFSFSGIKTAVLYTIKNIPEITDEIRQHAALEFEDAVTEVLAKKTLDAASEYKAHTIIVGGGVSANTEIRRKISELKGSIPHLDIYLPPLSFTTDNALMIAAAGYIRSQNGEFKNIVDVRAEGNLKL